MLFYFGSQLGLNLMCYFRKGIEIFEILKTVKKMDLYKGLTLKVIIQIQGPLSFPAEFS